MEIQRTKNINTGLLKANLAYVLADVINSLMLDAQNDFRRDGYVFNKDIHNRLKPLLNAARDLKVRTSDFTRMAYQTQDAANYCNDSDALHRFLLLLADRDCQSGELLKKLTYMVGNMQSRAGLIDI